MSERRLSKEREAAITQLIDDEAPAVRRALLTELKRLDDLGIALLKRLSRSSNRILGASAREYLQEVQGPDTVAEFIAFIRSLNYELETGCLLLNRAVVRDVDTVRCAREIDTLAARCRELMAPPCTPWESCKVINRVLFHENGFRGNAENFDDPQNSFLCSVLARRKGIPITLSILYLLVAQRCNLHLEPIGMPGRFLVGCFLEEHPFYIDPFERGAFRTPEELREVLRSNNIRPHPHLLAPSPVGEVLCRCCRNLAHQYSVRKNPMRAKLARGFVHEFEATYRRHANP